MPACKLSHLFHIVQQLPPNFYITGRIMQNLFLLSSSDDSIASDHTAILILLAIELTYKTEVIL